MTMTMNENFIQSNVWAERIGCAEFVECHVCDSLGVVSVYAIGVDTDIVGFKRTFACDACQHCCDSPAFVKLIDRPIEPAYRD
jgi:hypothetical protein